MLTVNGFTITPLETGTIWLDGGAMFGTVPKVLWEKAHPSNATNQIELAMRCLLIQKEDLNILVDCGLGDKGGEKFKKIYHVDQESENLEQSLQSVGLKFEDITHVILSHFHFDHAGGATSKQGNVYKPTFPNAKYYIQSQNLEVAKDPNPRERASYLPENHQALIEYDVLQTLDGAVEIVQGIEVKVSFGHTCAQQHIWIEDETGVIFFGGDLVATPSHVSLPWVQGYDLQPLVAIEEKKNIFKELIKKNGWVFYQHDPKYVFSRVQKNEKGRFEPIDLQLAHT